MFNFKENKAFRPVIISSCLCVCIVLCALFGPYVYGQASDIVKQVLSSQKSSKTESYDKYGSGKSSKNNFSDVTGKTKISDYIKDASVWYCDPISEKADFIYEGQVLETNVWDSGLLRMQNIEDKLCDTTADPNVVVGTYEWTSNTVLNQLHQASDTLLSKSDALDIVWKFLKKSTSNKKHKWLSMESFMRYQHYAAEFGYDILGCEIGADVPGSSVSVAFTRGAAKQYSKTWFVDFSLWAAGTEGIGGSMLNYSDNPATFNATGEVKINNKDGGQGLSATRRHHLYSYMAGARWLANEAGGNNAYYTEKNEDGYYKLSPHGLVFQEVYDFVNRNNDRGYTYTPYAIVLDYYHGLPFGLWNGNKVFEAFAPDEGDYMTQNLLSVFYPGWNKLTIMAENQLINTPYGDTTDVLLQNASQKVLNSYPVIILSGSINFKPEEVERYKNYVKQGGTLVLNTAYLKYFREYDQSKTNYTVSDKKGKVIVYGGDYDVSEIGSILTKLNKELIPFEIKGDVQYLMNVKNGSLVLTLINNKGVTKPTEGQEIIDQSEIQDITIKYTGKNKVLEVRDWFTGEKLKKSAAQKISIAPGDMAVIEFVL